MTNEQRNALILVLDFVERWNKQDKERHVAEAASILRDDFFCPQNNCGNPITQGDHK